MATLYPNPLPSEVIADPRRAAERKVYECASRLPDGYRVFYGVTFLGAPPRGRARDGEIDFAILHPERGLLALEVKGGRISRDGGTGRWQSIDRSGAAHEIDDPVKQAQKGKFALIEKLKRDPVLGGRWFPVCHAVAFPDCEAPDAALGPDLPREVAILSGDLAWLEEKLDSVFGYWENRSEYSVTPLSEREIAALAQMLAPTWELRAPLGVVIREEEREMARLTEGQFRVLRGLSRNRRVAVRGGAGTGKTFLALEKARRLASEGFRTLLTCYNKPLADYLAASAGDVTNLTVKSFHQLCFDEASNAGLPVIDPESGETPPQDYFRKQMPGFLEHALEKSPEHRFDAIVVDEGQDFVPEWWLTLQLALREPDEGILYIFYDDGQGVYRRKVELPDNLIPFDLSENLRNTKAIQDLARKFAPDSGVDPVGPEGRPPEFIEANDERELKKSLSGTLHQLVREEGIEPAHIAVLTGVAIHKSALDPEEPIGAYRLTRDCAEYPDRILLETIHRFKGLERPIIILVELEGLLTSEDKSGHPDVIYAGITRAKNHLVVIDGISTLQAMHGKTTKTG